MSGESCCQTPEPRGHSLAGHTGQGKEGRKGEVRGRWVVGGGEGPWGLGRSGEGALLLGCCSESGLQPRLTQPGRWFHHLLPKYLITGDRKSPLESRDTPPSPLLRARAVLTPAVSDPPLPSMGLGPPPTLGAWGDGAPSGGPLWVT